MAALVGFKIPFSHGRLFALGVAQVLLAWGCKLALLGVKRRQQAVGADG